MKLSFTILLLAALVAAGCTGEVPPPSCDGENLRAINGGALPQVSSLTEHLSHQNCAAQIPPRQPNTMQTADIQTPDLQTWGVQP
jgi:hypothetical protein